MPYIPFRVTTKGKEEMDKMGLRKRMFAFCMNNHDWFMSHYHKRSNVESTFTIVLAVASFVQWRTLEHQYETMEKSLRVSQAASIRVNEIQADFDNSQVRIVLENIGHVPVTMVRLEIRIERNLVDHPDDWPIEWNSYYFHDSLSNRARRY